MTLIRSSSQRVNHLELIVLASLSGLLYSSWPLGYILNPAANRGLASNLGGIHQPYNWLFSLLDIVSGLLVVGVAWLLLVGKQKALSTLASFAIYSYGGFGLLTAIDALIPEDCLADQHQCGLILQHPLVVLHGLISLASIGCLTLSLLAMWWLATRRQASPAWLRWSLHAVLAVWFAFGINTAILLSQDQSSALSQHVFIIACSLWVGALPYMVHRLALSSGVVRAAKSVKKNRRRLILSAKSRLGA